MFDHIYTWLHLKCIFNLKIFFSFVLLLYLNWHPILVKFICQVLTLIYYFTRKISLLWNSAYECCYCPCCTAVIHWMFKKNWNFNECPTQNLSPNCFAVFTLVQWFSTFLSSRHTKDHRKFGSTLIRRSAVVVQWTTWHVAINPNLIPSMPLINDQW